MIQILYTDHKGPLGTLIASALLRRSTALMANGVVKLRSALTPPNKVRNTYHCKYVQFGLVVKDRKDLPNNDV